MHEPVFFSLGVSGIRALVLLPVDARSTACGLVLSFDYFQVDD